MGKAERYFIVEKGTTVSGPALVRHDGKLYVTHCDCDPISDEDQKQLRQAGMRVVGHWGAASGLNLYCRVCPCFRGIVKRK